MADKARSFFGNVMGVCFIAAGAIVGIQVVGWLGGMLIWPAVWCFSCLGCIGDIYPKSSGQEMLARFAIGAAIMGVLVVKMSFAQRKKRGGIMKKIVISLAMLAVLIPAAAWAGESRAFSRGQEAKIADAVRSEFHRGIMEIRFMYEKDRVIVDSRIMGADDGIAISINPSRQYVSIFDLSDMDPVEADRAYKIKIKVENILNPPASAELGILSK